VASSLDELGYRNGISSLPTIQFRAFVVLGELAKAEVDDDFFYQMLVAFRSTLIRTTDSTISVVSMLRCIRNVVPALQPGSRYLGPIFWLAVALLQFDTWPLRRGSTITTCHNSAGVRSRISPRARGAGISSRASIWIPRDAISLTKASRYHSNQLFFLHRFDTGQGFQA